MLKTLLICTAIVGTPALAQMDGAMAGMDGSNQPRMMDQNSGADASSMMQMGGSNAGGMARMGGGDQMMPMMQMMMQMMQMMMMGQMQGMGAGMAQQGMGMGQAQSMGDTQQGMGQMQSIMAVNMGSQAGVGGPPLSEPGQSAFAAISEVVRQLEANPDTDWSSVDINALRQHLRDMDIVTIDSTAEAEDIKGGVRFTVTGGPDVAPSITRMVLSHAQMMDGVDGWAYSAEALENGAAISITVPETDLAKLKALGFYGMLASGPHHQPHHWAMANGKAMGN
ncbi:MAG: hypothetical protein L3J37_07140 [Rhodobacteraceae bacterium]|nr:hypothetical protein [Paracoccaceae bacterium]